MIDRHSASAHLRPIALRCAEMLWDDVLVDDYITDGDRLMEVTTKRAQRNFGLLGGVIFRFVHAIDSATFEPSRLDEPTLNGFRLVVPAR